MGGVERGARARAPTPTSLAVAKVRRDIENGLLAHRHLNDTLVPAFDDLTHADREGERTALVDARVELRAIRQRPGVVHCRTKGKPPNELK